MEKQGLKIPLLSDPEHKALNKYGVWQLNKMAGREYYGVVRSTFIINPKGKVAAMWRKVKVKGHVDNVLDKLKDLTAQD